MTAFLFTLACTSVSLRFSWLARSDFTLNIRYLLHNIQETNPHSTAILPPEHQNRISINYEHASEWPLAEKTFVSTATNIHFLLHSIAISSTSMEKHSKRFKREYTAYRRKCSWKSDYSLTNPHARLEPSIPVPGRAPAGLQPTNAHVHAHLGDARVAPVILAISNVNMARVDASLGALHSFPWTSAIVALTMAVQPLRIISGCACMIRVN